MGRLQALRLALVLVLVFTLGLASAATAPAGSHIGYMWPVGLSSGALLITPRRWVPYVAALLPALAFATFAIAAYPVEVAAGYGLGITLEALVARHLLSARKARRQRLLDTDDFGHYLLACVLAALTGAVVFGVTAALAGFGVGWEVAIAAFTTHLASELILLGLFRRPIGPQVGYGTTERILAWTTTITVTVLAFTTTQVPSLVFLVIPPLGWVAFRAPMREAMYQLVTVAVISSTLSKEGVGPFSDPYLMRLDPEFQHLPQQAFLLACAMVTIPFAMAVAMQRRSADQAMRERARSERLVQSARGIAIIGTDDLGRINLFSPAAESILGYTPEEVYGQSTRMFHTDAELARQARILGVDPTYVSVVRAAGQLPPGTATDWQFVRKDGIARTLSTILSPITDDLGRFVGYVATGDDITDRIEAQEALEKALKTERRAVARLIEVDQVKDAFISSVSHELRTPITNIVGYLELLLDGVYGEPMPAQVDAMARIDQNSRRLLTLIDDLLTLSSLENVDQRRSTGEVDLTEVITRAMEVVRPTLLRRELAFDVELPDEPVVIVGHAGELERLVINLATNAVKFTPDGGRIVVRLLAADEHRGPVIEVQDTGIGIPAEAGAQLFTRFFRTDDAHAYAVPGSGLGLSIAKAITDKHAGEIEAQSVYGEGSVFRVTLPGTAVRRVVAS
ncbi:ATP-binding protein [Marmoricola sp. RAF53]|uniref:sensor histidine kinase n=1 Tax=Marmoricola sp. RAF53 TaxID=3233059 RepID=UPI003F943730